MPVLKRKVLAYIVCQGKLLVFRHRDFPETGIQVPGGDLKENESPEAAIQRETRKEAGLENLSVIQLLGEQVRLMSDLGLNEIQHRYYFHMNCQPGLPETWTFIEDHPSESSPAPIYLEFFWAKLPNNVPPLAGGQDYYLNHLIDRLIEAGECCQRD